jgi:hypothetical protein
MGFYCALGIKLEGRWSMLLATEMPNVPVMQTNKSG